MKKKLGVLEDRLGLGNGKTLFKNQAAFAEFLGCSRKTVSTNAKSGKIIENRQGRISFLKKENRDYAEFYFRKTGYKDHEISRVIYGEKEIKVTEEVEHKKEKPKEKQQKFDENIMLPGKLKKYLDPDVEPDYSLLTKAQIAYIVDVRKLQKATIEVREKGYNFSISKGENVPFEGMKGVFNAIIEIIAMQLRSGVGRGFGKKIKVEFDTLLTKVTPPEDCLLSIDNHYMDFKEKLLDKDISRESLVEDFDEFHDKYREIFNTKESSDTMIVGALDQFHGEFSDELLKITMAEIKRLLEKEKLI